MANINGNELIFENLTGKEALDSGLIVKIDKKDESPSVPGPKKDLYTFNLNLLFPEQYPEKYSVELVERDGKKTYQNTFDKYFDYDFEVNELGSKLIDFFYIPKTEMNEKLHVYFASAWSPPVGLIKKIAEKFPKLKGELYYEEPGMGFQGTITIKDGNIEDKEEEYKEKCVECGTDENVYYRDDVEGYFCDNCYKIEKELEQEKNK